MKFTLPVKISDVVCHFGAGSQIIILFEGSTYPYIYLVVKEGIVLIEGDNNKKWAFFSSKDSEFNSKTAKTMQVVLNTEENLKTLKLEAL